MTTSSAHREMVQALENARDYPSGCDCMVDSETTAWRRVLDALEPLLYGERG